MQAVIMAGGFGTRLHPLTYRRPKPMVPVAGVPMMEHIVRLLVDNGFDDAISLLYYHGEMISGYFGGGEEFDIRMRYKSAESDLGTAGSVRNAKSMLEEELLVISADVLTDFDLHAAIDFHRERNSLATIVLTRHPTPLQFGIVIIDDEGRISRFLEKPAWGQVFSDTINTGIYILEPEVLDWIPKGESFDFSKDLFPRLLEANERLYGFVAPGYWRDVGNLREYRRANEDALWERVKLHFPGKREKNGKAEIWIGENAEIESDAEFDGRVLLGKGAKIGKGTFLANSVIGENSIIGSGAMLDRAVVWNDTQIDSGVQIQNATVAADVEIGANSSLNEYAVVADGCKIGSAVNISPGVKLWPDKIIDDQATLTESLIWTDRVGGELFTRSRISGTINWEFSPEFISKLGAALGATVVKAGGTLVVSRDPDRASEITARALLCGAMSAGVDVENIGLIPIPLARQYLSQNPRTAGVHIRKSPYQQKRQDLIFLSGDGSDMPTQDCRKIEQMLMREGIPRADYEQLGRLSSPSGLTEFYSKRLIEHIDVAAIRASSFRIVVDYEYGAAAQVMPPIHEMVGADVIAMNAFVSPNRLTKPREDRERAFNRLATIVKSLSAHAGFAIDPVGERLAICDENGNIYKDNELLYIVSKLYLSLNKPATIAVPISATMGVNIMAREYGVDVIRTKDEHLAMIRAARRPDIAFVGGTRGGFIFSDFGFGCDAMFSTMKMLEMMAKSKRKLSEVASNIPEFVWLQKEIQCPWHSKGKVMRALIEYTEKLPREIIDGVRVITSDAWILVLPDAEQPVFHLLAEGKDEKATTQLMHEYQELIKKCRT